ncbi:MAG TPA: hypothetical protein ACFYEK_14200, partial [Candidatus Wunengus sp. YC60]|uniref:hypothetical protein n=1 Tax=Candidatus Wunengus sp. YC60 TaxID=3367697 RepID=UPI004026BABC
LNPPGVVSTFMYRNFKPPFCSGKARLATTLRDKCTITEIYQKTKLLQKIKGRKHTQIIVTN